MSSEFCGVGNIGQPPELRFVSVDGHQRAVLTLRVYFDRQVPDSAGGFVDKGGHWRTVTLWGDRAERYSKILQKGIRIQVPGALVEEKWADKDTGEERSDLFIRADNIFIDPICLEGVILRRKADGREPNGLTDQTEQECLPGKHSEDPSSAGSASQSKRKSGSRHADAAAG